MAAVAERSRLIVFTVRVMTTDVDRVGVSVPKAEMETVRVLRSPDNDLLTVRAKEAVRRVAVRLIVPVFVPVFAPVMLRVAVDEPLKWVHEAVFVPLSVIVDDLALVSVIVSVVRADGDIVALASLDNVTVSSNDAERDGDAERDTDRLADGDRVTDLLMVAS